VIAIMNLIAKLGIIYASACHASFCATALDCLSVSCLCCHTVLMKLRLYKHGTGRGGRDYSESVAASSGAVGLHKVLCWLPLIASRNTPLLPSSARQPAPLPHRATDQWQPSIHIGVTLPAQWPT